MSDTEKPAAEKAETTSTTENTLSVPPVRPSNERQETGLLDNIPITPASEVPPPRAQRNVRFEEDEAPPQKPARPISPNTQNLATLIEAFPDIDTKVVKAVLAASGGQVEPAFNALLGMSDPSFEVEQEAPPPPMPPRPTSAQRQLEADEAYARRLAQKYQSRDSRRYQAAQRQSQEQEKGFFDDFTANELPEIRKNLEQGFQQTQARVNGWITTLQKRINGNESDDIVSGQGSGGRQDFGPSQRDQLRGIRRQAELNRSRHSMDTERYDADAPALSENFGDMELRDDDLPPRKPSRPLANPNLFKPTPNVPAGPIDEVDNALTDSFGPASATRTSSLGSRQFSTSPNSGIGSGVRSKKWQPLTSLSPAPDGEIDDDNDPFSLGDSDDEGLTKTKSVDVNAEATERLKAAAANRRAEDEEEDEGGAGSSSSGGKVLKSAERSGSAGTRDKVAEQLLKG